MNRGRSGAPRRPHRRKQRAGKHEVWTIPWGDFDSPVAFPKQPVPFLLRLVTVTGDVVLGAWNGQLLVRVLDGTGKIVALLVSDSSAMLGGESFVGTLADSLPVFTAATDIDRIFQAAIPPSFIVLPSMSFEIQLRAKGAADVTVKTCRVVLEYLDAPPVPANFVTP